MALAAAQPAGWRSPLGRPSSSARPGSSRILDELLGHRDLPRLSWSGSLPSPCRMAEEVSSSVMTNYSSWLIIASPRRPPCKGQGNSPGLCGPERGQTVARSHHSVSHPRVRARPPRPPPARVKRFESSAASDEAGRPAPGRFLLGRLFGVGIKRQCEATSFSIVAPADRLERAGPRTTSARDPDGRLLPAALPLGPAAPADDSRRVAPGAARAAGIPDPSRKPLTFAKDPRLRAVGEGLVRLVVELLDPIEPSAPTNHRAPGTAVPPLVRGRPGAVLRIRPGP